MEFSRESSLGHFLSFRQNHGQCVVCLAGKKLASLFRGLIFKNPFSRHSRPSLRLLRKFRGSFAGSSALIVAGGPSTSDIDFGAVRKLQEDGLVKVFALNHFVRSAISDLVDPDFVILSDPEEAPKLDSSETIKKYLKKYPRVCLALPRHWVPSDVELFYQSQKILLFEDRAMEGWGRGVNPTRLRRYMSLTGLKAMALAYWMGFEKVGLAGFDASAFMGIHVNSDNHILMSSNHHPGAGSEDFFATRMAGQERQSRGAYNSISDAWHAEATFHNHLDRFFRPLGIYFNISGGYMTSFPRMDPNHFLETLQRGPVESQALTRNKE